MNEVDRTNSSSQTINTIWIVLFLGHMLARLSEPIKLFITLTCWIVSIDYARQTLYYGTEHNLYGESRNKIILPLLKNNYVWVN